VCKIKVHVPVSIILYKFSPSKITLFFPLIFFLSVLVICKTNKQKVMQKWIQPIYQKHIKTSLISLLFPPFSMKTSVLLTSDPCLLVSDLELNPEYQVQTTIFLADKGSNEDYTGGTAFFIQEKEWNVHRRWRRRYKVQRGLAVDGLKGRIIVSTGGYENLHCYLPLKAGVKAALQVWWTVS
jgi:hypothetical protein